MRPLSSLEWSPCPSKVPPRGIVAAAAVGTDFGEAARFGGWL